MIHIFLANITTELCWWISKNPSYVLWPIVVGLIVFAMVTYMFIRAKKQNNEVHSDYLRVYDENKANIVKIKSLETNVSNIGQKLSLAKKTKAELQEQLIKESAKYQELSDKYENTKKEIDSLKKLLDKELIKKQGLSTELYTRNGEIYSLQQQISVLEKACADNQALKGEVATLENDIEAEKEKIYQLSKELDAEREKNFKLRNDIEAEKEKIYQLSKELDAEREKNSKLRNDIEAERDKTTQLAKELELETGKQEELKTKYVENLRQLSPLRMQLGKAQKTVSTLTGELDSAKSENASLQKRIEELESDVEEKEAFIVEKNNTISELEAKLSEKEQSLYEKDLIITENKSTIDNKDKEIVKKDAEIAEKNAKIESKESELSEINQTIADNEVKIKELEAKIESNEELRKANETINELKNQIVELTALLNSQTGNDSESVQMPEEDEKPMPSPYSEPIQITEENNVEETPKSEEQKTRIEVLPNINISHDMSISLPVVDNTICRFSPNSILCSDATTISLSRENIALSSNKIEFSSYSGNRLLPNALNLGKRGYNSQEIEPQILEYIGESYYVDDSLCSMEVQKYPCFIYPMNGTPILNYHTYGHVTGGVTEPLLYHYLLSLKEIEPEIDIIQNISIPVSGRNYGYKPDIAVIWKKRNIYIDIEIDEPYDILSRKPIHYKDGADALRNSYISDNGWFIIRLAEEQIVKSIKQCKNFVSFILYVLTGKDEFHIDYDLNKIDRWSYEEAQNMSRERYRESYLGIEVDFDEQNVDNIEDNEYCAPVNFEFTKPSEDIFYNKYNKLFDEIIDIAKSSPYIIIKDKIKGYEYVTDKNHLKYIFNNSRPSINLFDIIETKYYNVYLCNVDSFWGVDEIIKDVSDKDWKDISYECMINCNPIKITYNTANNGDIKIRTVLYLSPGYEAYTEENKKKCGSAMNLIKALAQHNYVSAMEIRSFPIFSGFCLYRQDIRTFNTSRIIKGVVYNCYKPSIDYEGMMWQMLEKGEGVLAEIIYTHLPSIKKNRLIIIGNYCNALVMQGKHEEALEIYKRYNKNVYLPNVEKHWYDICLGDFDYFIDNDISKSNFLKIKESLTKIWLKST